jgi:hypothetical protein
MQRSKAPASVGETFGDEGKSNTMNLADMIASLPEGERAGLLEMAQQYQDALTREKCHTNFLEFVKAMWPGFIHGRHHAVMAKKFEAIAEGKLKRLIINMPPRHTKSEFASYLLPAWFLGKYPNKKITKTAFTTWRVHRRCNDSMGKERLNRPGLKSGDAARGRRVGCHGVPRNPPLGKSFMARVLVFRGVGSS